MNLHEQHLALETKKRKLPPYQFWRSNLCYQAGIEQLFGLPLAF